MCGAGGSVGSSKRRYASKGQRAILGKRICDDSDLRDLLKDWGKLGVSFIGAILLAEGKESETEYSIEWNKWTTVDTVLGDAGVILKTSGDGWLYIELTSAGFRWEHASGSYRRLTQAESSSGKKPRVVDSSTQRFSIDDVQFLLREQKVLEYANGTENEFADFAKRLFDGVSGKNCEGVKPHNALGSAAPLKPEFVSADAKARAKGPLPGQTPQPSEKLKIPRPLEKG